MFHFPVQIYYEDTDHSGFVYHANYLKYFERAREHAIGKDILQRFWFDDGIGFVVYEVDMHFTAGAEFGDVLDIRSTYTWESKYRLIWHQEVWHDGGIKAAVIANVHMVCIDHNRKPIPIPRILDEPLRE